MKEYSAFLTLAGALFALIFALVTAKKVMKFDEENFTLDKIGS